MIDGSGLLRALSGHIPDIGPEALAPDALRTIAAIDHESLPHVDGKQRYGIPFTGTRQFVAIGLNYLDHAHEARMALPDEPIVFMKAVSCLCGPNDDLVIPDGSRKTDWEVELGVVIGTAGYRIVEKNALDHVAGYCVVNDISEREYQLERGGTWDKGKSFPGFGPVGPWLVTADEVPEPQTLSLWLELNGERMQDGNTASMIFGVARLISYVSSILTLLPGDIIITGTPAGVGMGLRPEPRFMKLGDRLRLGIGGLGEQSQLCVGGLARD